MKLRLIFFFLLISVCAYAQPSVIAKNIKIAEYLSLRGIRIDSISIDPNFLTPSHYELPTARAVYDFVNALSLFSGSWNDLTDVPADIADGDESLMTELPLGNVVVNAAGNTLAITNMGTWAMTASGTVTLQKNGSGQMTVAAPDGNILLRGDLAEVKGDTTVLLSVGADPVLSLAEAGIAVEDLDYLPVGTPDTLVGIAGSYLQRIPVAALTTAAQAVDTFTLNGTDILLSLSDDGQPASVVDLSPLTNSLPDGSGSASHVPYWTDSNTLSYDASQFVWNATDNRLGIGTASPQSRIDVTTDGLGVTQSNSTGILIANNTTADAGAQQMSPGLRWRGQGWKTTATAASQTVDFLADVLPVQGTTAPSGTWQLKSSINGAAYTTHMVVTSSGNVGIGTTSPSFPLSVNGNANVGAFQWILNSGGIDYFQTETGRPNMFIRNKHATGILTFGVATGVEKMRLDASGRLGIGQTSPTAFLHLPAGTATASTAPLKLTAGTNLTAAEAGAVEWDGTNLFVTQTTGPTRKTIAYTTDITANYEGDSLTDTTDGSGIITVNHSLGTTPVAVTATISGAASPARFVVVDAKSSTDIDFQFFDDAGNVLTATSITFDWIAIK